MHQPDRISTKAKPRSAFPRAPLVVRTAQAVALTSFALFYAVKIAAWLFRSQAWIQAIPAWADSAFTFGMLVIQIVSMVFAVWSTERFRQKLESCGFMLCMSCHYPLKGLEPFGQCPECGTGYNTRKVRRVWLRWFGDKVWTGRASG